MRRLLLAAGPSCDGLTSTAHELLFIGRFVSWPCASRRSRALCSHADPIVASTAGSLWSMSQRHVVVRCAVVRAVFPAAHRAVHACCLHRQRVHCGRDAFARKLRLDRRGRSRPRARRQCSRCDPGQASGLFLHVCTHTCACTAEEPFGGSGGPPAVLADGTRLRTP